MDKIKVCIKQRVRPAQIQLFRRSGIGRLTFRLFLTVVSSVATSPPKNLRALTWLCLFLFFPFFPSLSVPVVCCCRRATSSPRLSTTISWPLGAGQLWLVSTALLSLPPSLPLFFFFFFEFIDSLQPPRSCGCAVSRQRRAQAAVLPGESNRWQRPAGAQLNRTFGHSCPKTGAGRRLSSRHRAAA